MRVSRRLSGLKNLGLGAFSFAVRFSPCTTFPYTKIRPSLISKSERFDIFQTLRTQLMNRFGQCIPGGCAALGAFILLGGLLSVPGQPFTNTSAPEAGFSTRLRHLSLADAQKLALDRNWDLLAAASGVDAATALKILSREFPNPTVSLSSSKINVDNQPNSTSLGNGLWDRSYDTIFAVNQLFEIGGKRHNRQLSAQAGYETARAQFLDAKRTLDLAVAKAYFTAAQDEENTRVLLQSAETLRQEAALAEIRLKAGEISAADKNQIEINAERFELDARTAQSAAAQARVVLEVLMGVPHPGADCVLTDRLEGLVAAAPPPATNSTGVWRPDVVAAEAAWRRTEADLRLQKAYRIPDPTVLAQVPNTSPPMPQTPSG